MGQMAATVVTISVLIGTSLSAARATYDRGTAPEGTNPHAHILEYCHFTAYGAGTVLSARDNGTSIRKVNDGDYDASGAEVGSHNDRDVV